MSLIIPVSGRASLSSTDDTGVSCSRTLKGNTRKLILSLKCGFVFLFLLCILSRRNSSASDESVFILNAVSMCPLLLCLSAPTQMRSKERHSPRSFSRYDDYERDGRCRRSRSRSYDRRRSRSQSYERRPRRSDSPRE